MAAIRQTAERLSLSEYRIYAPSGQVQTDIALHQRVFAACDAPLTPALKALGLADTPTVTVDGRTLRYCKALRSDKFFANRFDLSLQAPDSAETAITARFGGKGWTTLIRFEGQEFALTPKSWFGFKFELRRGEVLVARFTDVSPFLSFSSRRRYLIEYPTQPLAPVLLAFGFLLALSSTYRLGL